jgi:hypothetical protein
MTELEATQRALLDLGSQATVGQIVRYATERLGLTLNGRFVPLYLASVRGQQLVSKCVRWLLKF